MIVQHNQLVLVASRQLCHVSRHCCTSYNPGLQQLKSLSPSTACHMRHVVNLEWLGEDGKLATELESADACWACAITVLDGV